MTELQAIARSTPPPMSLQGVSWQTFQTLLAEVGSNRPWRIAYDRGVLEIRMPLAEHEEPKELIADFITSMADLLDIELRKLGALTLARADLNRAVEPDTCFYIQNEALVRGKNINLSIDPPPDLVVESDYTNSSLNKLEIYAALGVPELWRYQRPNLEVYQLIQGEYQSSDRSLAFPLFPIAEIPNLIAQSRNIGQRSVVKLFRHRISTILLDSHSP